MKYSLYKIPNNKIDFQVSSLNMYTCTGTTCTVPVY